MCVHTRRNKEPHVNSHIYVYICKCIHTYTYTHIHTCVHTHRTKQATEPHTNPRPPIAAAANQQNPAKIHGSTA